MNGFWDTMNYLLLHNDLSFIFYYRRGTFFTTKILGYLNHFSPLCLGLPSLIPPNNELLIIFFILPVESAEIL